MLSQAEIPEWIKLIGDYGFMVILSAFLIWHTLKEKIEARNDAHESEEFIRESLLEVITANTQAMNTILAKLDAIERKVEKDGS